MGDLRGALVDFADLGLTILVLDIPTLYQLLQFRQALCAIYFTRAGLRPGAPAGIGPAGPERLLSTFRPRGLLLVIGYRQCHMPYGTGTARYRALDPV